MNAIENNPPAPATSAVSRSAPDLPVADPWPEPVDGKLLLDQLTSFLTRYVVLPESAAESIALWVLHTYAFQFRNISPYLAIESPEKRCGKSTLLALLAELVNRPILAANISPPAFFRLIHESQPTLLIDEADAFLQGRDETRAVLNSGYTRTSAYVIRVASPFISSSSSNPAHGLVRLSCWCPKVIALIGRVPDTLADRSIIVRMQRKTRYEPCQRLGSLDASALRSQCARFAADHRAAIAAAKPDLPPSLNDRAADIWEPLFALADLAAGPWPTLARNAALSLSSSDQNQNPAATLLLDILVLFLEPEADRMFSQDLVAGLARLTARPWAPSRKGKPLTECWLAQQLRPYGIRPAMMRIADAQARGYLKQDFLDAGYRYLSLADLDAISVQPAPASTP